MDVVIRSTDLSVPENAYQLYEGLRDYEIETWVNNAGFGNYDSVANQDLGKIGAMLHLMERMQLRLSPESTVLPLLRPRWITTPAR